MPITRSPRFEHLFTGVARLALALAIMPAVLVAQAASARTLRVVTSGDGVVTTADRRSNVAHSA